MEKAVKTIWHHYASTKDTPLHGYCPEGPDASGSVISQMALTRSRRRMWLLL